jgi:hypothetical protein
MTGLDWSRSGASAGTPTGFSLHPGRGPGADSGAARVRGGAALARGSVPGGREGAEFLMSEGELAAVFKGLAEDAGEAGGEISESIAKFTDETADIEDANIARTLAVDADAARPANAIGQQAEAEATAAPAPAIKQYSFRWAHPGQQPRPRRRRSRKPYWRSTTRAVRKRSKGP